MRIALAGWQVGGEPSRRVRKQRGGLRRHSDLSRVARSPVSVPIASGAMPSASATADPDDEPPGARGRSVVRGFSGVPKWGFSHAAMARMRGHAASRAAGVHQVV
jgi:hypothetical protein